MTMDIASAQLLMNLQLRSLFDCLFPDLQYVQKKQAKQAASHNHFKPLQRFKILSTLKDSPLPL